MKQKAKAKAKEERGEPVAPLVALTVVVPPWVHAELVMANPAVERKRAVSKQRQTKTTELGEAITAGQSVPVAPSTAVTLTVPLGLHVLPPTTMP
jgi:hypothetical protein